MDALGRRTFGPEEGRISLVEPRTTRLRVVVRVVIVRHGSRSCLAWSTVWPVLVLSHAGEHAG